MNPALSDMLSAIPGSVGIRTAPELYFDLLKTDGNFELRIYSGHNEAFVDCELPRKRAGELAFPKLFDYIRGENEEKAFLSMTAPVFQELVDSKWRTSFYLDVKTPPGPSDSAMHLDKKKQTKIAAISFSGTADDPAVAAETSALQAWIKSEGLHAKGAPRIAYYDPPFTVPFLRRNEIWIPVA